ncbi:MAG: iron ABC transporter permease [Caldibacillus debilis]|jgi:iron complex transport system permease protein|uniref:ABC-type Fe3+-siderophore transport system, permease component n=2 Tax=Caldibacillus debilis TaxID=301148 RepID=A0A420VBQ4_9BACI|nr:iron ABC transporter permease [Caldibacillus debilis]REJ23748.1 MAG: iron ABC transporter permease [Caldibacillus debilis]RKO61047.1 ABC-type Fe3+-siderophore transport system, permease component [Caldibacillus debilis GB1]
MSRKRRILFTIFLIILLFLSILYSLTAGSISVSIKQFVSDLGDKESFVRRIVWDLRLPRIIVGLFVGMCLAVSGAILQGVMKNPLADPGIIGVTSGAGLAATVIMVLYPDRMYVLPLAAFLGAFLTAMLVYLLAWQDGTSIVRMMLVGIAVNAFLGAIMSLIMILHSDKVQAVLPWLSGGISGVSWVHVEMIVYYAVFALVLAFFSIKSIRMLMLGDEVAALLGQRVERSRFFLIFVSALLAGIAVSVAGLVGFVGLIVPHIIRLLAGNDYRYLLPLSCLGGGILVVFADAAARSWFDPIELPVGILLSFLGGPFFLYLVFKGGAKHAHR